MNVGEIIRKARIEEGYTQRSLAALAGCSDSLIANIETSHRNAQPSMQTLQSLASALNRILVIELKPRKNLSRTKTFDDDLTILEPRLRHDFYKYAKSKDDLDDLIQETKCRAMEYYHTFNPRFQLYTWLYSIAYNIILKRRHPLVYVNSYIENNVIDEPEMNFFREYKNVFHYLNRLDKNRRECFKLKLIGVPYKEIARQMNTSEQCIKNKIRYTRQALRQMIENDTCSL